MRADAAGAERQFPGCCFRRTVCRAAKGAFAGGSRGVQRVGAPRERWRPKVCSAPEPGMELRRFPYTGGGLLLYDPARPEAGSRQAPVTSSSTGTLLRVACEYGQRSARAPSRARRGELACGQALVLHGELHLDGRKPPPSRARSRPRKVMRGVRSVLFSFFPTKSRRPAEGARPFMRRPAAKQVLGGRRSASLPRPGPFPFGTKEDWPSRCPVSARTSV